MTERQKCFSTTKRDHDDFWTIASLARRESQSIRRVRFSNVPKAAFSDVVSPALSTRRRRGNCYEWKIYLHS